MSTLKPGSILVIDDDDAVCEAVTDILSLDGWQVLTATSGETGVSLYKSRQADIFLVILDLTMPGMSGQETLAELRAVDPTVKVLMSSGYSETEIKGLFDTAGIAGFLHKPYNALRLLEAVGKHIILE